MKQFPALLTLALVWGCSVTVTPPEVSAPLTRSGDTVKSSVAPSAPGPTTNYFAYAIDPNIAGRYGIEGDVAWADTGSGRRPAIIPFGEERIEFQPGVTEEDLQRFSAAFHATILRRERLPGPPDGSMPAMDTNTYYISYDTDALSLDGFDAQGEASGFPGSFVFSSERAAKYFYQFLRITQNKDAYKVRFLGLNGLGCMDDCGPDGGPVPTFPSIEPKPTPTPTPMPETTTMALESFECEGPRPLGKLGVVKVVGVTPDLCWAPHEVNAVLDQERFEVRLQATRKRVADVCGQMVQRPIVYATFLPKKAGTYRIIGTVVGENGEAVERTCELEMVESFGK